MHITFVEIVTSLILYACVHSILWVAKNAEKRLAMLIKTERGQIIRQHSKDKHSDTLRDCTENRCKELETIATIDVVTA